jgi:hypothetical protein
MYKIEVQYSGNLPGSTGQSPGNISSYIYNEIEKLNFSLSGLKQDLDVKTAELQVDYIERVQVAYSNAVDLMSLVFRESTASFELPLPYGVDSVYVPFPNLLLEKPSILDVSIENDADNIIYSYKTSQVTDSGFFVDFSDNLNSYNYVLRVYAGINQYSILEKINQQDPY